MTRLRRNRYQRVSGGMLRAAVRVAPPALPPWPDPGSVGAAWRCWLRSAWSDETLAEAVSNASPDLARQVNAVIDGHLPDARRARRAALAVGRYAIRSVHRSTPFGLFAGVAPVTFAGGTEVCFGGRPRISSRPDPVCLETAISKLENDHLLMAGVKVCVNNLARVHDGRVHVPSEGAAEYSVAMTPAVALVMRAAKEPIRHAQLVARLAAEFPGTGNDRCAALLRELLRLRMLRSGLRAPATVVDPAETLPTAARLRLVDREARTEAAIDLRLDARVRLPEAVGTELETAATLLARLAAQPAGTPAWRRYAERFADRYGEGAQVGVEELTDPQRGLGFPEGFGTSAQPSEPCSPRDRALMELAGAAALDGARSVTLTGAMIEELEAAAGCPVRRAAPHLELSAQVLASSTGALDRGDFRVRVQTASRGAGTMTGRFWHLFADTAVGFADLPTVESGATMAQLSFHPSRAAADLLARAPRILPTVVSVGEFRDRAENVLFPGDLAIGIRDGRLYLVVCATGEHLELLTPTAINFVWNHYTPPLARFLAEISRAACPQVTGFDWGVALALPFTPALCHRRTILIPARWRLRARQLPGRLATLYEWTEALHSWRERFGVPSRVLLAEADQHLLLDLSQKLPLDLLRTHLASAGHAVLAEAPPADGYGWIDGRAHSVVVPMGSSR